MDGLRLPRAQRRRSHRPRLRRERLGEPVQIDGFEHRWFEGEPSRRRRSERGGERPPRTRLVFIDDATSPLMRVRFVLSESTFAHLDALEGHLAAHGRPVALAIVLGPMADEGSSHIASMASGMIVPPWLRGPRGPPTRVAADRPFSRIRRRTRSLEVRRPARRSRARTLR